MWEVLEIKRWVSSFDIESLPACECSKEIIHRTLLRILFDKSMTAKEVMTIFDQIGSDITIILSFINDSIIDDARKRSLWMIAWYYDETKWLTVPKDFLPHFEFARREKQRTQAYAFSQAYVLSKKIALNYLNNKNLYWYYHEIPNLLIACMQLHQLWVFPLDIWSRSWHETLLSEAMIFAEQLQIGVKDFFIKKTPDIAQLLETIRIRQVV